MKEKGTVQKDRQVQDYLSKRYSGESRRSFFSKLSRVVFGMAGFHLASRLEMVAGPPMFQIAPLYCGIVGYRCGTGNCNTTGTTKGTFWKACCQDTANNCWRCCTYTDYCKNSSFTPSGCTFTNGGSGPPCGGTKWCGTAGSVYVCTSTSCEGTYSSQTNCASGC